MKASKYNVEEVSCPMRVRMVTRHLDHENTVIFVWVATNGGRVFSLDSSILSFSDIQRNATMDVAS